MQRKVNHPQPPTKAPAGPPPPPPPGGRSDTIVLPVTFVRHVARLRAAQEHDPESRQAKELAKLVDDDLKVIARVLAEMGQKTSLENHGKTPRRV